MTGQFGLRSFIRYSLFELNDHYLAVRVDFCVYISVYLPPEYSNDQSERLFALSCERLGLGVGKNSASRFTLCYRRRLKL